MHNCHRILGFLFGAFLVVFTFFSWTPVKWIAFGIGVVLVLHAFMGDTVCCKSSCGAKPEVKKLKKK